MFGELLALWAVAVVFGVIIVVAMRRGVLRVAHLRGLTLVPPTM